MVNNPATLCLVPTPERRVALDTAGTLAEPRQPAAWLEGRYTAPPCLEQRRYVFLKSDILTGGFVFWCLSWWCDQLDGLTLVTYGDELKFVVSTARAAPPCLAYGYGQMLCYSGRGPSVFTSSITA